LTEGAGRGEQWLASSDKPTIADIAVFPYVAMAESVATALYPWSRILRYALGS